MTDALTAHAERLAHDRARTKKRKQRQTIPEAVLRAKVHGKPCRVCVRSTPTGDHKIEAHHLVPRGKFATDDPLVNNPDNVAPICATHHTDHHTTGTDTRIVRQALTEHEQLFVFGQTSESWMDKWYPDEDGTTW